MISLVLFYLLAGLLVAAALMVVLQRNVVYCAMALVAALFLIALLFLTLDAPLIGVLQVLIYAGAIMVLFLFVIMLLTPSDMEQRRGWWSLGGVAALLLGSTLIALMAGKEAPEGPVPAIELFGSPEMVGKSLFTDFILPFEIVSVLLLVAIIGAVVLAKRGH